MLYEAHFINVPNLDILMKLLGMGICPSFSAFPTLNQRVCLVTQFPARFERIFSALITNKSEYATNFLPRQCNQNACKNRPFGVGCAKKASKNAFTIDYYAGKSFLGIKRVEVGEVNFLS